MSRIGKGRKVVVKPGQVWALVDDELKYVIDHNVVLSIDAHDGKVHMLTLEKNCVDFDHDTRMERDELTKDFEHTGHGDWICWRLIIP